MSKRYAVHIKLTEPMLGSAPADPKVYEAFIASKRLKLAAKSQLPEREKNQPEVLKEELGLLPEESLETAGITVFRRKDNNLIMMDFQIRGFFKEAAEAVSGTYAIRNKLDKWFFPSPRYIFLKKDGKNITSPSGQLERPLRAMTMQGPRVALASSETVAEGTELDFVLTVLPLGEKDKATPMTLDTIKEWLDYGALNGLGQWRTGGYGRFEYTIEELGEDGKFGAQIERNKAKDKAKADKEAAAVKGLGPKAPSQSNPVRH